MSLLHGMRVTRLWLETMVPGFMASKNWAAEGFIDWPDARANGEFLAYGVVADPTALPTEQFRELTLRIIVGSNWAPWWSGEGTLQPRQVLP